MKIKLIIAFVLCCFFANAQYPKGKIPLKPSFFGQRTMHLKSRSGTSLVDQFGNNATILTPAVKLTGTTSYFRILNSAVNVLGGQPWDVTFKFNLDDSTRRDCLFMNGGNANTSKGITIMPFNGNLIIYTSDSTAFTTATIACHIADSTDYVLRFQWNGITGGTMTITLNGTVYTTTTNKGWARAGGTGNCDFGNYAGAFYMKGVYSSARGIFGGYYMSLTPTGLNATEYDLSVPGRVLGFSRTNGSTVYSGNSTYFLDYGYSIQKQITTSTLFYLPNDSTGAYVNMTSYISGGTTLVSYVAGNSVKHNLWKSKIRFVNSFFDRSNTTIWNATARTGFYDAAHTKDFDISEINLQTLNTFLNDGYRGMLYPKFYGNSIDDRQLLSEIILLSSDRKNLNQLEVLRYTGDIYRCQRNLGGTYYVDANNYLSTYLYGDLGGDADSNYTYFQGLINSGVKTIGNNPKEVFALQQPLTIPSNSTLEINGEFRPKKGTQVNITTAVVVGDTVYHVSSTTGFHIGEWVASSDASLAVQGGSSQTRKVASCGQITAIGAGTLTLNQGSKYAIPTSGKLMHCQSVILLDSKTNITISGSGVINGNWTNQYDVEPVGPGVTGEDERLGCGISVYNCTNIKIIGGYGTLTVKNAVMQGIAIKGIGIASTGLEISNITANTNHDKGILSVLTDGLSVHDCALTNSIFEDGITLYTGNINFSLKKLSITGNGRIGLNILSNGTTNGVIDTVTTTNVVSITSSNCTVSNITMTGGYMLVTDAYTYGNNNTFNNIYFTGITGSNLLSIQGNVHDNTFNNVNFNGCNGTAIYADKLGAGVTYPYNIIFNNGGIFSHTGTHSNIVPTSSVIFNSFANP